MGTGTAITLVATLTTLASLAGLLGLAFHPQFATNHPNDPWCAVMGGAVYRGSCFPDLVGDYFSSDLCVTELWSLDAATAGNDRNRTERILSAILSIHPDALGELYVTMLDGAVLRVIVE